MIRDDDALAERVELRSTGATEHLEDVLRRELDPATLLRVVDLGALDNDRVRRQVDAPRQRRRRDEDLDVAVGEELFDERAVDAGHAGVVDREAERQQVLEVAVGHVGGLGLEDLLGGACAVSGSEAKPTHRRRG